MDNLISIIIPAYNIEKYIGSTLDSVLAQTYSNIEVIVVNDGSRDGTAAVIDCYASRDSRIKAIHKENGGVTSARLRGVAEATGEWIGFVDGDDLIEPWMYEHLLNNALNYEADISHCGYQMVFPSRVDYYYNTGKRMVHDHMEGLRELVVGNLVEPSLWNKLFRRELFAGLEDKMDFTIKINEDVLMNYWLFDQAHRSVFEDVCPYLYQIRAGSAANSRRTEAWLRDPIRVNRILLEVCHDQLAPFVLKRHTHHLIRCSILTPNGCPELVLPFRRECRKELRQRLGSILRCPAAGRKLKLMALLTAIWPGGYSLVHRIYARISGADRKYEIS
jgi:glycosyltransferase involved in cell wall biosynthesis